MGNSLQLFNPEDPATTLAVNNLGHLAIRVTRVVPHNVPGLVPSLKHWPQ